MTDEQKDFILNKLIPFVLRDQGRGFAMERWLCENVIDMAGARSFDGIRDRCAPICGTVCCIGGSIQLLLGLDPICLPGGRYREETDSLASLGLTYRQRERLFYGWIQTNEEDLVVWPENYRKDYANAKTTEGKAAIVCDLLRKIVQTEGACLS